MILPRASLNQYVIGLAKALHTRGFDLPVGPSAEFDESGDIAFAIRGVVEGPSGSADAEITLDELWQPLPEHRWERSEYTYDLIDHGRGRRRAFHVHDRALAEARLRSRVHEHCEETLGDIACAHYLGRELPDGYVALDLLMAAWLEPDRLGCSELICLVAPRQRSLADALRAKVRPVSDDETWEVVGDHAAVSPDPDRGP